MWELAIAVFAIAGLAAFAQSVSGFGSALIAAPLLTMATGPRTAVVIITILGLAMSATVTARERRYVEWRLTALLTASGLVGMPVGLLLLTKLDPRVLTLVIVVLVLVAAVTLATGWSASPGAWVRGGAGVLSGAMLTSTGMNGPPLVVTMHAMRLPPVTFRSTLQAAFCAQDTVAIAGFALVGAIEPLALVGVAAGLPALPVGWWLGDRVFARLDHELFRRIVIAMLVLSALVASGTVISDW
jgi:uncharacterized protein